jgi:hypothetical protein
MAAARRRRIPAYVLRNGVVVAAIEPPDFRLRFYPDGRKIPRPGESLSSPKPEWPISTKQEHRTDSPEQGRAATEDEDGL